MAWLRKQFPAEAAALIADLRSGPGQRRMDAARVLTEAGGIVHAAQIIGTRDTSIYRWKYRGWKWGGPRWGLGAEAAEAWLDETFGAAAAALRADLRSGRTPQRMAAVRRVMEAGAPAIDAARLARCSPSIVIKWRRRGWAWGREDVGRVNSRSRKPPIRRMPTPAEDNARLVRLFGEETAQVLAVLRGEADQARLDCIQRVMKAAGKGGGALVARLMSINRAQITYWQSRGWRYETEAERRARCGRNGARPKRTWRGRPTAWAAARAGPA